MLCFKSDVIGQMSDPALQKARKLKTQFVDLLSMTRPGYPELYPDGRGSAFPDFGHDC